MSRVLDYLETDKAVDAKRVATHGHSRTGKAALVAMAYDERFANGFISSSGQSGAKLHRRKYGEVIENIAATNEYHWMAGNYMKYARPLGHAAGRLALSWSRWSRRVRCSSARATARLKNPDGTIKLMEPGDPACLRDARSVEQQAENINDAWVDAKGTFLAGVGAGPVYRCSARRTSARPSSRRSRPRS